MAIICPHSNAQHAVSRIPVNNTAIHSVLTNMSVFYQFHRFQRRMSGFSNKTEHYESLLQSGSCLPRLPHLDITMPLWGKELRS
jgi:hypothetical protein